MKKFRFTLQPVRALRELKERTTQQRYLEALRSFEEASRRLQAARQEYRDSVESFQKDMIAGVSSDKLAKFWGYCQVLEEQQKKLTKALEAEEKHVQATWREMVLATRDREALERYYLKQRRLYNQLVNKDEQKTLDELAARMAGIASSWRQASDNPLN